MNEPSSGRDIGESEEGLSLGVVVLPLSSSVGHSAGLSISTANK